MSDQSLNNKEIQARIVAKAWSDPGFRKELLANPKDICSREGLIMLGEIQVCEQRKDRIHFILPLPPEGAGDMNQVELEKQAGISLSNSKEMF